VVNIGSALHYLVDLRDTLPLNIFVEFTANIILFLGLTYFIVNGLTSRKGFFSNLWTILLGVVGLGLLTLWQKQLDGAVADALASQLGVEVGGNFIVYIQYVYYLGLAVAGLIFFRNRRDVKHWFPAKK
jgi:chromate transport protein ChrA